MKKIIILLLLTLSFAMSAKPPIEPMIIYGEIIKDNLSIAKDVIVKIKLDNQEYETKTILSYSGRSIYEFKLSAEVATDKNVEFISCGNDTLSNNFKYEKGIAKIANIILNSSLPVDLLIEKPTATKEDNKWTLKCDLKQNSEELNNNLKYEIKWFAYLAEETTETIDEENYPNVAKLAETTVNKEDIKTITNTEIEMTKNLQDVRFLKLVVYSVKEDDTESIVSSIIVIQTEQSGDL